MCLLIHESSGRTYFPVNSFEMQARLWFRATLPDADDEPARVGCAMRLNSADFRPVRLHAPLFLQFQKVACPRLASTYSSPQMVQMRAGTSRMTMVVSSLFSATVVVPGSVSPYWQITHFIRVSSWSSVEVPTYSGLVYILQSRSRTADSCHLQQPHREHLIQYSGTHFAGYRYNCG